MTLPERLLIVSNVPKTLVASKEVETVIKRYGKFKKVLPLNGKVRNSNLTLKHKSYFYLHNICRSISIIKGKYKISADCCNIVFNFLSISDDF